MTPTPISGPAGKVSATLVRDVRRGDGRIVGQLRGDTLHKTAKREHILRTPPAWAWDDAILTAAEKDGARFTEIKCDGLIYRASLSDFQHHGFYFNRGYGIQRGLALAYWHIQRIGEPAPATQLELFEVAP